MNMRTSLIITGDNAAGKKAVEEMAQGMAKLAAGAKGAVAPAKQLDGAMGAIAQTAEAVAAAQGQVASAVGDAARAASLAAQSARANEAATADMAQAAAMLTGAVNGLADAQDRAIAAARADIEETRRLAEQQRQASQEAAKLAEEQRKVAAAAQEESRALDVFRKMLDPAAIAQAKLNEQLEMADRLHSKGILTEEEHARVKGMLANATTREVGNVALQRAGYQQLGFQMQDVMVQYQMGTKLSTIFAQQSGQMAGAIQMIAQSAEGSTGKLGKFASLLGGPLGIAIGVAVPLIAMLADGLMETGEAAKTAELGASGLSDAQGVMGEMFDLASGKIQKQNELLVLNARLTAINLRAEAAADRAKAANVSSGTDGASWTTTAMGYAGALVGGRIGKAADDQFGSATSRAAEAKRYFAAISAAKTDKDRQAASEAALAFSEKADFSGLSIDRKQFQEGVIGLASSRAKDAIADLVDKSLDDGKLAEGLKRPDKAKKPKKVNSGALDNFADSASEAIARIDDQYNTAPKDIDQARQATAKLDAIIKDVNEKLTTSKNLTAEQRQKFDDIKMAAGALKPVIEASLTRPITDMLDAQERQIAVGALQVSGHKADAEALQLTYSLMDKMGVETEEQLATELAKRGVTGDQVRALYANLGVMREQTREMRIQEELQRAWLGSIDGARQNLNQLLRDIRTDGPKALGDFFTRSQSLLDQLFADVATEKLFGGLFRDLTDQVTGADKVSHAGDKMAAAVNNNSNSVDKFTKTMERANNAASGGLAEGGVNADGSVATGDDGGEITVIAKMKGAFKEAYEGVFTEFQHDLSGLFKDVFGELGDDLGTDIAGAVGKGLAYMQLGQTIGGGIADVLGMSGKYSKIGSQIGSAIGGALLGPLGAIGGGFLGSIAGGLIKGKPMLGSTVLTSATEKDTGAWGRLGGLENVNTVAGAVQNSLKQIASTLGASLGDFAVSIGNVEWNGQSYYRVADQGRYDVGTQDYIDKGGAVLYDGTDADAAMAAAVMNAIADGAMGGISAAMKKALSSSPDVDEAVSRALKVREVEQYISGLGSEVEKALQEFETTAAERVKIAQDYGLDVLEVEKKNGEERAALIKQLTEEQVGSLQRLVEEMTSGSLFEGSAVEQRAAIMDAITAAKADLDNGVSGAADTLADLYRQLNTVSKDAFGTTGQYAADRTLILDQARAAIAASNAKIEAAATKTSDPALASTNAALDENNDQNAQVISLLQTLPSNIVLALKALGNGGSLTLDLSALAATS